MSSKENMVCIQVIEFLLFIFGRLIFRSLKYEFVDLVGVVEQQPVDWNQQLYQVAGGIQQSQQCSSSHLGVNSLELQNQHGLMNTADPLQSMVIFMLIIG